MYGNTNNNNKNSRDDGVDNCTLAVQEHYKFYLAFENSFCNDYVTEKFFRHVPHILTVVLGQADYGMVAPPHSYINVMEFEQGPKQLADYLWELDRNATRYLEYFWWKQHYSVYNARDVVRVQAMCKLCEKLHNTSEPLKTYPNLYEWWTTKGECGRLHAPPHTTTTTNHLRIHWTNG
jgi:alpha-1,3-fucosyltransferase